MSKQVGTAAVSDERYPFSPFPSGWYCVALARDLVAGELLPRRICGREVVLYRGASGRAYAVDAYCPHLGAHFAHGGEVIGETLRCPFHGFRFDGEGRCVETPYPERKPPPSAKLAVWQLRERNGLLLLHFAADGAAPAFEVPEVDFAGWEPLATTSWQLRSHPQETTENSVDAGHFTAVHGYRDVEELEPLHIDGPYLSTCYAMTRKSPIGIGPDVRARFRTHIHGLGYSFVEAELPALGLRARYYVLPRPTDGEQIELRVAGTVLVPPLGALHPLLRHLPTGPLGPLLNRISFAGFCHDVRQDFDIWQHKRYVHPPRLAAGDGPVGRYRRWARQFYPAAPAPATR